MAGLLLATRIIPAFFTSPDVTGHEYIEQLGQIAKELSAKEMADPDLDYLRTKTVEALSYTTESLVDNKAIAMDTRSRTRWGLILLAVGTFMQGVLLFIRN